MKAKTRIVEGGGEVKVRDCAYLRGKPEECRNFLQEQSPTVRRSCARVIRMQPALLEPSRSRFAHRLDSRGGCRYVSRRRLSLRESTRCRLRKFSSRGNARRSLGLWWLRASLLPVSSLFAAR